MNLRFARVALAALVLAAPHPLFAKAPTQATAAATDARFILVEGGRNFRDVGGYRTATGRQVLWGRLYRSGSLGGLTDAGRQTVAALHVRGIIDLRSSGERATDRGDWLLHQQGYFARDYELGFGNLSQALSDPAKATPDAVHAMMAEGYRRMIEEQAPSFRELFLRLGEGKGPLIVNCTAGKDRTGIATALVLRSIGVPYATVRRDFLLSNGAPGMTEMKRGMNGQASAMGLGMPPEVMALLGGVDGSWLDAAFDEIGAKHGSLDRYLTHRLGLTRAQLAAVRRNLLR